MTQQVYSLSPYSALGTPAIQCYLYRPPASEFRLDFPYDRPPEIQQLRPVLHVCGAGFPEGEAALVLMFLTEGSQRGEQEQSVKVENGRIEIAFPISESYARVDTVRWELVSASGSMFEGVYLLRWSHFTGRVIQRDGRQRTSYIDLTPVDFNAPGRFMVPVSEDGRFDVRVPARVYAVMNIDSGGYGYDALERWAWDYDLTRDRHDEFIIGRTELYGMRAFDIKSPLSTLFVLFRPTALSRVRRFAPDERRLLNDDEKRRLGEAMRTSPTVIGPELCSDDVKVWFNGEPQDIVQFDQIPEYDGGTWQVQYLLQIFTTPRPARGVWHDIKVQVESREELHGREVVDFGEGSVGFFRD